MDLGESEKAELLTLLDGHLLHKAFACAMERMREDTHPGLLAPEHAMALAIEKGASNFIAHLRGLTRPALTPEGPLTTRQLRSTNLRPSTPKP